MYPGRHAVNTMFCLLKYVRDWKKYLLTVSLIFSYKKLCNDNSAELPASFVLVFDKYIPVDAGIMAKICKLVNGQGDLILI